jgi:transposase
MKITRGYKTELALNNEQITLCKKHAGAARFAWNWALNRKQEVYKATGRSISAMELHRELNDLKQTEYPWLYEVSKCAPQEALRALDVAFSNFFRRVRLKKEGKWRGPPGYPKFKSKRKGLGGFKLTGAIHVYEDAVDLPRLGRLRLKECGYLPTSGVHVLSATVTECAGRWYVSIQVREEVPDPKPATGEPVGVDLGISAMATCSDGVVIENPKALRSNLTRLKRLQRRLSRSKKGSKNREQARRRLARHHAKVANIRRDALHKATAQLTRARLAPAERAALREHLTSTLPEPKTKERKVRGKKRTTFDSQAEHLAAAVKKKQVKRHLRQATESNAPRRPRAIVLEDLHVSGLLKNHHLAQAIADVGLAEFRRQVEYKSLWQGETLHFADRWYPSTKRCSKCGHVKASMDLSERVYVCEREICQHTAGRDFNAAVNLAVLAP